MAPASPTPIDPGERVPPVAWPTVALFAGALMIWGLTAGAYLADAIAAWIVIPLNAIVSFVMFTVLHDCCHTAAGSKVWVNKVLGRLAMPFVASYVAFPSFRFIHMQHHLNTNESHDKDPDSWISHAPAWQLPLRWMTVDLWYMAFYLTKFTKRPRAEWIETFVFAAIFLAAIAIATIAGFLWEFAVIYLIPQRIGLIVLAWWFDWLPHHGLSETQRHNKYRATRNRVGAERLLTPVMLSQNYHLVHHLHPLIPFYRYIAAWRRNEDAYLANDPALSGVVGEITVDEYRRRRAGQAPS